MNSSPPQVATWLLECWCAEEALVGDLAEQYRNGRSRGWYWREAFAAMAVGCRDTVLNHKWLALRAIVTGWAFWLVFGVALPGALRNTVARLEMTPSAESWAAFGRFALPVLAYSSWVAIGWIIGRLHRPHQIAMVLVYVVFALVMCVPNLGQFLTETFGHPSYSPTPGGMAIAVISLLLGGVLSTPFTHQQTAVKTR